MVKLDHIVCTMLQLLILQAFIVCYNIPVEAADNSFPPKFTLKTIKVDNDIVDCVDIHKQPSLDHPLLQNHTVQIKPSSYPQNLEEEIPSIGEAERNDPWGTIEQCPAGTVPILRMNQSASHIRKGLPAKISNLTDFASTPGHEHAIAYFLGENYGGKAKLNVWSPQVDEGEFSLAQIWVISRSAGELNTLEAGWTVHPVLYGDTKVRFFIFHTTNGYNTEESCYNLACRGFVLVGKRYLGAHISPVSTYGGKQYVVRVTIFKDPISKNWWLTYNNDQLGYWPADLFTSLKDNAEEVHWGGEVVNSHPNGQHTATQMGSGHFAEEGGDKASYVGDIRTVNSRNTFDRARNPAVYATRPECYNIKVGQNSDSTFFYYGGPGRSQLCQ